MRIDARIPVVFTATTTADDDHLLTEDVDFHLPAAQPHPADCACCVPRSPVAGLLGGLFFARARGEVPFFRRLVVHATQAGEAAFRDALVNDPVASGCYRIA